MPKYKDTHERKIKLRVVITTLVISLLLITGIGIILSFGKVNFSYYAFVLAVKDGDDDTVIQFIDTAKYFQSLGELGNDYQDRELENLEAKLKKSVRRDEFLDLAATEVNFLTLFRTSDLSKDKDNQYLLETSIYWQREWQSATLTWARTNNKWKIVAARL